MRKAKKINTQGYILIYKPEHHFADYQGYVREHRIVFEEIYKCSLLPWGDVHHKNGNKLDNRKKNLEGMMHYKHLQLHIDESRIKNGMLKRKCSKCGSNVTRMRQHEKVKDSVMNGIKIHLISLNGGVLFVMVDIMQQDIIDGKKSY